MPPKSTIADARKAAARRGGACLSEVYVNSRTHMLWQCEAGHEWEATLANINKGRWCPLCRKLSLADAQAAAAHFGGECLSTSYANIFAKMRWRCARGHEWEAGLNNIRNKGSWCPACAGVAVGDLSDCHAAAARHGGKCLSDQYINRGTRLRWRCMRGHEWNACPASIKTGGSWCPNCPYRSEGECRELFESFTGHLFPKLRPKWLHGMELDGFNEILRLAFEYQGRQHYDYIPHFHREGEVGLQEQKDRDSRKQALCEDNWVTLVIVPYWARDKRSFIRNALLEYGYLPSQPRAAEMTLTDAEVDELLDW